MPGEEKKMIALHIAPNRAPRKVKIKNDLNAFAKFLGGEIEFSCYDEVLLVCRAYGKMTNLPFNRAIRNFQDRIVDLVAGSFLVLGLDEEGKSASLSKPLIKKYTEMFRVPEKEEDIPPNLFCQFFGQYVDEPIENENSNNDVFDTIVGAHEVAYMKSYKTKKQQKRRFLEIKQRKRLKMYGKSVKLVAMRIRSFRHIVKRLKQDSRQKKFFWDNLTGEHIIIPDKKHREISSQAFAFRKDLKSVVIPSSVNKIRNAAFLGCANLSEITIPDSVTIVEELAFDETPWLEKQPDGMVYAGRAAYVYKGEMPQKAVVELREGTASITRQAFMNASENLENIEELIVAIPDSVTHIDECAFDDCNGYLEGKVIFRCNKGSYAHNYATRKEIMCELNYTANGHKVP